MKIGICTLWANAELKKGDTEKLNLVYQTRLLQKDREEKLVQRGWDVTPLGQFADMDKAMCTCKENDINYLWVHLESPAKSLRQALIAKLQELGDMTIFLDGLLTESGKMNEEAHNKRVQALKVMGITYLEDDEMPPLSDLIGKKYGKAALKQTIAQ